MCAYFSVINKQTRALATYGENGLISFKDAIFILFVDLLSSTLITLQNIRTRTRPLSVW